MENLISGTELWYRRLKGSCLQRTAGGYAPQRLKTDGSISGRTRRKGQSGNKCLNASTAGMKKTAAVKTSRMKNGRGRKTGIGKIG